MKRVMITKPDGAEIRHDLGYLNHAEVLALVGINKQSAANRQCSGDWPRFSKIGMQKLYRRSEIDAWIQRRESVRRSKS